MLGQVHGARLLQEARTSGTPTSKRNEVGDVSEDVAKSGATGMTERKLMDLLVRVACLALLAYWTVALIEPFLTIVIWSIILTVVLYPFFIWMVKTLHLPRAVAALLLTAFCLAVLLGPAAVLGVSLVGYDQNSRRGGQRRHRDSAGAA